jgi:glyoxylase-like metal-dependent hydrolase (beta-lactamase superfamily II)
MSRFRYEQKPDRGSFQEVIPGVRRIVANNPSPMTYHGTNTYLIESPEGLFVIDPGPAEDEAHVEAIAATLGEKGAGILVTHHHSDHFGAVPRLRRETGMPVYASTIFADVNFRPDIPLSEGDNIAGLRVLHTPGHASDHLCFRRDDGVVFTGDHIMTWNSSVVILPDGDMAAYCRQLERLAATNDTLYLPGHGPPLSNPTPYARRMLQHRVLREQAILQYLTRSAAKPKDIAQALYHKTEEWLAWSAERNVEAHLDKLMREGRATHDGQKWYAL